jgi:hypothetical protein
LDIRSTIKLVFLNKSSTSKWLQMCRCAATKHAEPSLDSAKFSVDGQNRHANGAIGTAFGPGPKRLRGAARMKKVVFVLAAAGLMSLAACSKQTPAENATDATANALDNAGENLEDMADNTSNDAASAALDNAADNAHSAADAVEANKQ